MSHIIRSITALASLAALVAAQGCGRPATDTALPALPALPALDAQAQNPGEPIALSGAERAAADSTKHIVVLFMQNNSFNKLFGLWDQVNGDPVDNIARATPSATTQVGQDGAPLGCLLINDVNLQPGAMAGPPACTGTDGGETYSSAFPNAPFLLNDVMPAGAVTETVASTAD